MKFRICVCLLAFVVLLVKGSFPDRKNLILIVDVSDNKAPWIGKVVTEILDSISLLKYRIALYSTNGLSQTILDFQSRECATKILRKTGRSISIIKVLNKAGKYLLSKFRKDENIIVVLTERRRIGNVRSKLNRIGVMTRNEASYVIQIKRTKYRTRSILWRRKGTSSSKWIFLKMTKWKNNHVGLRKIVDWLQFTQPDLNSCEGSSSKRKKKHVYDECNRQCECRNGKLVNCFRVRRQFSALSLSQRNHYINAYKILGTHKPYRSRFYKILLIHPTVNFKVLHSPSQLLPFHRKYTLVMENLLRLLDCRITIPYWNFPLYSHYVYKSQPGYHMWDSRGGFGSTKTHAKNGFCIETGPFKWPRWRLPEFFVAKLNNSDRYDSLCDSDAGSIEILPGCKRNLRHGFNPRCITRDFHSLDHIKTYREVYEKLHSVRTTFKQFEKFLRLDCHATIHDNMGGDFGYGFSSMLPEFFPLHSYFDAMWTFWQDRRPNHSRRWRNDKQKKIIGFHMPRYFYVDNDNLEDCGLKIKYTNIFTRKPHRKAYYDVMEEENEEDDEEI